MFPLYEPEVRITDGTESRVTLMVTRFSEASVSRSVQASSLTETNEIGETNTSGAVTGLSAGLGARA